MKDAQRTGSYWRRNLGYLAILLTIGAVTAFLCSFVFAEQLDRIRIGGSGLGFLFSQQAAVWIFVALIFVYAGLMNRLDRRYRDRGDRNARR